MIAEGFHLSEKMCNLHCMFVIGDGNSSVMVAIWQSVPYGIFVIIIKCANHTYKAFRSK